MKYLFIALCVGTALARPDGAGGHGHHSHDHAAPAAAAPASGYEQPASGYGEPAYTDNSGYAPSAYEQTGSGYEDAGYTAPATYDTYAVADDGGVNLSFILIPILVLLGLFLLFPSTTVVPVARKKRDADDEISGNSVVERIQDMYMAVLESEECMERVACEVGGLVSDAGVSKKMFKSAEAFVPSKYSKMMKNFNSAKDCHKIKCGSLF
jgi:hypothetical protein